MSWTKKSHTYTDGILEYPKKTSLSIFQRRKYYKVGDQNVFGLSNNNSGRHKTQINAFKALKFK